MKKVMATALLATFAVSPAFADFYVVREKGAKECTVVRERPSVKTTVVMGNGKVFKTEEEARGSIKTICTN